MNEQNTSKAVQQAEVLSSMDFDGSDFKHSFDSLRWMPLKVIENKFDEFRKKAIEQGRNKDQEQHFSGSIDTLTTTEDVKVSASRLITAGEASQNIDGVERKQCMLAYSPYPALDYYYPLYIDFNPPTSRRRALLITPLQTFAYQK